MATMTDASLTEFFRDLLRESMRSQAVDSSEETEFYLVKLLERFARPDSDWFDRPLALEYLEAHHTPTPERCRKLKKIGDTTLFVAGVLIEAVHRQPVSADYYIGLGRSAYGQLSALTAGAVAAPRDSFAELAARFPDFVRVLADLSMEQLFRSDARVVRVYTRWLCSRGQRDGQWLMDRGIVPFAPEVPRRH